MNRAPGAFDNEVRAAEWLVRLDADRSATTLSSWRRWLREDVRHHVAFARLEASWRQADCLQSLRPLDRTVDAGLLDSFPGVRPATGRRGPRWSRLARLPAPYGEFIVAVAAGGLASLLVLAGWLLLVTLDTSAMTLGEIIPLPASQHTVANN